MSNRILTKWIINEASRNLLKRKADIIYLFSGTCVFLEDINLEFRNLGFYTDGNLLIQKLP